jgi:Ser-tRNA(Ala) deacylase AlaX
VIAPPPPADPTITITDDHLIIQEPDPDQRGNVVGAVAKLLIDMDRRRRQKQAQSQQHVAGQHGGAGE